MIIRTFIVGFGILLVTLANAEGFLQIRVASPAQQQQTRDIRKWRDNAGVPQQPILRRDGEWSQCRALKVSVVAKDSSAGAPPLTLVKLCLMFAFWYGFNAGYNVFNAYMKRDFPFPLATAALQLLVGMFYVLPLWGLNIRKLPSINAEDFMRLMPIAVLNAIGHACGVCSMFERGGGSFTHVIKASEPVVSVLLGFVVNGIVPRPFTALSLLPITYGVAFASTLGNINPASMSRELNTGVAKLAMASNFAFAMRSIMRRNLPADFQQRTNLDPANEHAVTTLLSFLLLLPLVLLREGAPSLLNAVSRLGEHKAGFAVSTLLCGMCYYLYNEMQNVVLGKLGPVPTAVGNTLKRVVIFVALFLFTAGETFPLPKIVGCAISIVGCLAFAVFDSKKL